MPEGDRSAPPRRGAAPSYLEAIMHDAKGRELEAGDLVLIPAKVRDLHPTEDYCNVSAVSVLGRRPDGLHETFSAINTGVMLRANPGDENDLAELQAPAPTA
ncbi:MAG: hypothetical protein IT481_08480 [Gammaproteobacteria bacterium]|nr:hypothetical protein [Gammaproteobacteria bacterium]